MNIKITYNFLLDYLETNATAYELQKFLSLCGPSIETVEPVYDSNYKIEDYVLDIEITSNRIDMASVFGIAQEAAAILPQFGKKARLKQIPSKIYSFKTLKAEPLPNIKLNVEIKDAELCQRFTAMGFEIDSVGQTPELISRRLKLCDISSINTVVDISNYIMISLGQPTHMFDLDKIAGKKLILRKSVAGEKMTTLDGKSFTLPGDDIVIEDGDGKIIDMCGIMGAENSAINNDTTKILFFVQTYNKTYIRKTSMKTGQRSVAATYFEKGLDPNNVETAFAYGVELLNQHLSPSACTELIDIYPHKVKNEFISITKRQIDDIIGIPIEKEKIGKILEDLGFIVKSSDIKLDDHLFHVTVPTSRINDVSIKEDIIEEVARIYGYHNLPNNLPPMTFIRQPKELDLLLNTVSRVKSFLKHIGLNEFLQYSMISGNLLKSLDIDINNCLKIANSISTEIEYMRPSLLPSMILALEKNEGKKDHLNFFEVAKVYLTKKNSLPDEEFRLSLGSTESIFKVKGVIEALLKDLAISNFEFKAKNNNPLFSTHQQAEILINGQSVGEIGKLAQKYINNREIKKDLFVAEIDIWKLAQKASSVLPFAPISPYATVKRDITMKLKNKSFNDFEKTCFKLSKYLNKIDYLGSFENNITIRLYFTSHEENISETLVSNEVEKILKKDN